MQLSQPRHDDVMPGRQSTKEPALAVQPPVRHSTVSRPSATGDSTMNATLPPEAWRSEAFAEDLPDETTEAPATRGHRGALLAVLLGVLPVALAAAGAVAAVWSGA